MYLHTYTLYIYNYSHTDVVFFEETAPSWEAKAVDGLIVVAEDADLCAEVTMAQWRRSERLGGLGEWPYPTQNLVDLMGFYSDSMGYSWDNSTFFRG